MRFMRRNVAAESKNAALKNATLIFLLFLLH